MFTKESFGKTFIYSNKSTIGYLLGIMLEKNEIGQGKEIFFKSQKKKKSTRNAWCLVIQTIKHK